MLTGSFYFWKFISAPKFPGELKYVYSGSPLFAFMVRRTDTRVHLRMSLQILSAPFIWKFKFFSLVGVLIHSPRAPRACLL